MARATSDYKSRGDGSFSRESFGALGDNVIFEHGVMVFHPENIRIGRNVYVGHGTILHGYHKNTLTIDDNTWIGQQCFIHGAGGISIGSNVGIGPGVKIMSSFHEEEGIDIPIMSGNLVFAQVSIGNNCDLGIGCIVLPGVSIGEGCQIGAGAVVTRDVPDFSIAAGVPAKVIRSRKEEGR